MKLKLGLVCFLLLHLPAGAQYITLGVQGSSTANGVGAVSATTWFGISDSSWIAIVNRTLKAQGLIDTTHKRAASAMDIYNGMWTGYLPPAGRNAPNEAYNCTALMTRMPKVDVAILAYPSTTYDIMSVKEVIERMLDLKNYFNENGAVCYLLSTQPRDNFSLTDRIKLKKIRDTMMQVFGHFAIDVFTEIADPVSYKRKPEYAAPNDALHLNNAGHRFIAQQVLAKNIAVVNAPLPLQFRNVRYKRLPDGDIRVDFELEDVKDDDAVYASFSTDGGKIYQRVKAVVLVPRRKYYAILKPR